MIHVPFSFVNVGASFSLLVDMASFFINKMRQEKKAVGQQLFSDPQGEGSLV